LFSVLEKGGKTGWRNLPPLVLKGEKWRRGYAWGQLGKKRGVRCVGGGGPDLPENAFFAARDALGRGKRESLGPISEGEGEISASPFKGCFEIGGPFSWAKGGAVSC